MQSLEINAEVCFTHVSTNAIYVPLDLFFISIILKMSHMGNSSSVFHHRTGIQTVGPMLGMEMGGMQHLLFASSLSELLFALNICNSSSSLCTALFVCLPPHRSAGKQKFFTSFWMWKRDGLVPYFMLMNNKSCPNPNLTKMLLCTLFVYLQRFYFFSSI